MHKLVVFTIALILTPSIPALGSSTAEFDPVPVRNWQAPAYWAVPAQDDGTRSVRLDDSDADASALATATLAFVGIAPCRVADTRQAPPGEFGQPWMPASTVRSFTLTGQCAIPADAEAVSFNFTVTNTAGAGFLLVYPAGGPVPGVSTLNYLAAQTIANAAVVPLGTLGPGKGISTIPGVAGFDLIIDVNGYYTAQGVVSSLNGRTGAVSITAGSNVVVTPSGQNVQVSAGPLVSSLKGLTGVVEIDGNTGAEVSLVGQTVLVRTNGTSTNDPNTLVARDTAGEFAAGTIDLGGSPYLLTQGGVRLSYTAGSGQSTYFGYLAGGTGSTGASQTAFGYKALGGGSTGGTNSAFGNLALAANSTGSSNSAFGSGALDENVAGSTNAAFGSNALTNCDASSNTALGSAALNSVTSGAENVGVGRFAGTNLQSGSNNIYVGVSVAAGASDESNRIRIGNSSAAATFIRGISGVNVGTANAVYVNSSGQLGTATSSARFKDDIAALADPSPLLQALRPVSFVYKADETRTPQAGLIAEEVEAIAPHLVTRDEDGRLLSVRYDQLVPLLLAEAQRLERDNARLLKALEELAERMAAVERDVARPLPPKP